MSREQTAENDGSLGAFLGDFQRRLKDGAPSDSCVLCGTTTAPLHPVDKAWACSRCHTPIGRSEP